MKRAVHRGKCLPTDESRQAFVKQRNVSLLRKSERNINEKDITGNKKFWKTIKVFKPFFSDKAKSVFSITLKDKNKIVKS